MEERENNKRQKVGNYNARDPNSDSDVEEGAERAISFRFKTRDKSETESLSAQAARLIREKEAKWEKLENTAKHQTIFHPNGSINMDGIVDLYLMHNNTDRLPVDEDLILILQKHDDPYTTEWDCDNPGLFIFCSYAWDTILTSCFLNPDKAPSYELRKIRDTFIDEMEPYVKSGMDMGLFRQCGMHLIREGFRNAEKENFYEVPAILRTLAPTYCWLQYGSQFYMQKCLQGLPHSVLMKPFELFSLYDIRKLKNPKLVSTNFKHTICHFWSKLLTFGSRC